MNGFLNKLKIPPTALRVAVLYIILAGLWILFSDRILAALVTDTQALTRWQTIKGGLFVLVMALILYIERAQSARVSQLSQAYASQNAVLFAYAPNPIWVVDLETLRFLAVNQAAEKLYGYTRDEFVGMTLENVRLEGENSRLREVFKMLQTREAIRFTTRHVTRAGEVLEVDVSLRGTVWEGKPAGISVITDISQRILAEEKFRSLYVQFEAIVQSSPLAIVTIDPHGIVRSWNPAAMRMFGWSEAETVGSPVPFGADEAVPESLALFEGVLQGKILQGLESTRVRKDRTRIDVSLSATALRDEQGAVMGVLTVLEDISDRKQAEQQFLDLSRRHQAIIEASPLAIITLDPEGRVRSWNPAAERIFGWSQAEALGLVLPYVPQDKLPEFQALLERVLSGESLTGVEARRARKDGTPVDISISTAPLFNDNGAAIGLVAVVADISESKRAQEELRSTKEFLSALLENAPVLVYASDANQCLRLVNRAWEQFFSLAREGAIGQPLQDLLPGQLSAQFLAQNQQVIDRDGPVDFEEDLDLGERRVYLHTVKFPLHDSQGGIEAVGGISIDISDQKKALDRLRLLNADLERLVAERTAELQTKNSELETFTYSVSHDLKAPLRGIDGYSRLLQEEYAGRLDAEGLHFLHSIRQAVEHMSLLIDDLLAYSRLERRSLAIHPVDPARLIQAILSEYTTEINRREIRIEVNLPFTRVYHDNESLFQALHNLIENAIKFTRDNPEPRIEIGGQESQEAHILWVRDNGAGFEMRYHDRIFDIFQRLKRSEDFPGTGIGLAIVRKAMERVDGKAWAESTPGQGSTFFIQIPKRPEGGGG